MNANHFTNPEATVVLGVKFNGHTENLLRSAEAVCQRTGMRLKLVHVCEQAPAGMMIMGPIDLPPGAEERLDELIEDSDEELAQLAKHVSKDIPVSVHSTVDIAADGLIKAAASAHGALIISGASKGNHRFIPKGFSTALALMADSPVPVLVIPETANVDLRRRDLKMLIADDIRSDTEPCVLMALELAAALGDMEVEHFHVTELVRQEHTRAFLGMPESDDESPEFYLAMKERIVEVLKSRAAPRLSLMEERRVRYSARTELGRAADELFLEISAARPDLVVFGRHHVVHRHPLFLGRVPSRAMLTCEKELVIVPPAPTTETPAESTGDMP